MIDHQRNLMGQRRALALVALLLVLIVSACSTATDSTATRAPSTDPAATGAQGIGFGASFVSVAPDEWNGGAIAVGDLPSEALDVLALIADDGPYPYRQDGSTFQNREGILPDRNLGFYREFTVDTPGSSDRGARRLVVGEDSAAYYTDDHYDSFRFVGP